MAVAGGWAGGMCCTTDAGSHDWMNAVDCDAVSVRFGLPGVTTSAGPTVTPEMISGTDGSAGPAGGHVGAVVVVVGPAARRLAAAAAGSADRE